jgi:hypothetical protein
MFRTPLSKVFNRTILHVGEPVSGASSKAALGHIELAPHDGQETPSSTHDLHPQHAIVPARSIITSQSTTNGMVDGPEQSITTMFAFMLPVLDMLYPQLEALSGGSIVSDIYHLLGVMAEDYRTLSSPSGRRPFYASSLAQWCYLNPTFPACIPLPLGRGMQAGSPGGGTCTA